MYAKQVRPYLAEGPLRRVWHRLRSRKILGRLCLPLHNYSATEEGVAAVECGGLTGGYSGKWLVELNVQGIVGLKRHGAAIGLLAVAYLYNDIVAV